MATARIGRPTTGSPKTSNTPCVAIQMKPMPATVPRSAARGRCFLTHGPMKPPRFTFLKAKGMNVGESLVDDTKLDYCREMLEKAEKLGKKLLLPVDTVVADAFPDPIDAEIETKVVKVGTMEGHEHGLDIGPESAKLFAEEIRKAKTVVWNGPMGVFENPILARGTKAVAQALAEADAITVIGGGDSAAAVNQLGFADKVSHISTGGGASLEYLEGKVLPGVEAADDK